jgi:predicted acetyltransferase
MLEIRRIKAEEVVDSNKVGVIAFNDRHDFSKQEARDPMAAPHEWTWGAFENGRLVSQITDIPYVMRFDGHDAKMSGIGGVATLPEARKGGLIGRIFGALLNEAYANGVIFSCLAPFSHQFYRRYGYELCCTRREIRVPVKEFEKLKSGGAHEHIFPGGDITGLRKVHETYIKDINHAIRRDIWPDYTAWRVFTRNDPYNTGNFVYLWRDDAGEPRGYIKYQHRRGSEGSEINIRELLYLDREALNAQLAFIGKLSAEIKELIWAMPMFIDPSDFVEVAWAAKQRLIPQDMTRVVNVKTALELMRRPEGEGEYVIETEDAIIPGNNGRWLVEFGPEGSRVTATRKDADLACELPALAQLVTGYRTLESMLLTSRLRVEVRGNASVLYKTFTPRPQHLTENF